LAPFTMCPCASTMGTVRPSAVLWAGEPPVGDLTACRDERSAAAQCDGQLAMVVGGLTGLGSRPR
jgi:hypothetical protein